MKDIYVRFGLFCFVLGCLLIWGNFCFVLGVLVFFGLVGWLVFVFCFVCLFVVFAFVTVTRISVDMAKQISKV